MDNPSLTTRLAGRLRQLRLDRDLSLDALAAASGVSRATLSRLEKAEVSPTAAVLGRLCATYRLPVSRLMAMAEGAGGALVRRDEQALWRDPDGGFERRAVSPPMPNHAGEVVECDLAPGRVIDYPEPPLPGQEHHLVLLSGALTVRLDNVDHTLAAGDCLRYRLHGASGFRTLPGEGARYLLFLI